MSQESSATLAAYYRLSRPELTQLIDPAGLRILEVGCASGAMGAALLAKGAMEVVGLDIHLPALAIARTQLSAAHRVNLDSLPELPYPEGHFDLITFADVLEHLRDPAEVLRHLGRWLAPAGKVLVSLPNVRHESVIIPLLVDGRWDYADAGILDRTHLRFFTRSGMQALLASAGFELVSKVVGTQTTTPVYVAKAAELIKELGGDDMAFLAECNVVQFIAFAAPCGRFGGRESPSRPATPERDMASRAWAGARPQRVLLVPEIGSVEERWAEVLPLLAQQLSGEPQLTLAIALPPNLHLEHPPVLKALPQSLELDLLLVDVPESQTEWEALLRGTTILVLTSPNPELRALARRVGVTVHDALQDPTLSRPLPKVDVAPSPAAMS